MAKFTDVISGLTESTDPQGDSDYIVGYDGSAVVKVLIDNLGAAISLDALGAPSDSTSLNASTDAHGLLPKLDGTVTNFLNGTGGWTAPAGSGGGTYDYILIQDQKSQGTNGGTFDNSAWRTRVLTTEVSDSGNHASISSNQITLAAGTYDCFITCPAMQTGNHNARLYNISDSDTTLIGTSGYGADGANYATTLSIIQGQFTIAGEKVFEVQHLCATTKSNSGFGQAGNLTTEVYTSVELRKVA